MLFQFQKRASHPALATVVLLVAMGASSRAADTRVQAPHGWKTLTESDAGGGHTVLALESAAGGGFALSIHRAGEFEFIDLPAPPTDIRISPDGGMVLANLVANADNNETCAGIATLATTEGRIVWQSEGGRRIDFSSSGGALLAWSPPADCDASSQLELLDIAGNSSGLYDAGVPISTAAALGRGQRVLFTHDRTLRCVDLSTDAETCWQAELLEPATEMRALHFGLIDITTSDGRHELFDSEGERLFAWSPGEVAKLHGGRAARYANYRPFSGTRNEVLWFNGGIKGFRLDTRRGRLEALRFDASPPKGFAASLELHDGRLLFHDGRMIILRPAVAAE